MLSEHPLCNGKDAKSIHKGVFSMSKWYSVLHVFYWGTKECLEKKIMDLIEKTFKTTRLSEF